MARDKLTRKLREATSKQGVIGMGLGDDRRLTPPYCNTPTLGVKFDCPPGSKDLGPDLLLIDGKQVRVYPLTERLSPYPGETNVEHTDRLFLGIKGRAVWHPSGTYHVKWDRGDERIDPRQALGVVRLDKDLNDLIVVNQVKGLNPAITDIISLSRFYCGVAMMYLMEQFTRQKIALQVTTTHDGNDIASTLFPLREDPSHRGQPMMIDLGKNRGRFNIVHPGLKHSDAGPLNKYLRDKLWNMSVQEAALVISSQGGEVDEDDWDGEAGSGEFEDPYDEY